MPDYLKAAEFACKSVRTMFAAVGAATDALIRCEVRPYLPETPDASAVATRGAVDGPDAGGVSTPASGVGPNSPKWLRDLIDATEDYVGAPRNSLLYPLKSADLAQPQYSAALPVAATDPAGVQPQAPAGSFPDWNSVALPAICDVLAEHVGYERSLPPENVYCSCGWGKGVGHL